MRWGERMKEAIIQYNDNPDVDGGHMVISWEPLVRCKDCKHYDKDMIYCNKFGIQDIDDDWFCADGVKRE